MRRARNLIARRGLTLLGVMALVVVGVACSDGGGSVEAMCEIVRTDRSVGAVFTGFDPTDAERALERLRTARVTLGELLDAAPDEVRGDLTVEIDYVQALIDGLAALDDGDPAQAVEVARQVTAEHPDVGDAAANLAEFSAERCEP